MRDEKFRVWVKLEKKYLYPLGFVKNIFEESIIRLYVVHENGSVLGIPYKSDEIIFEWFTGLRDKNGKEIYEGDIVTYLNRIAVIEYCDAAYELIDALGNRFISHLWNIEDDSFEIIGNKFENPELL
jgi:uncharacterized phage protein (TIGR01671 family)